MYEVYLTTGVLLFLIGTLTIFYFLYSLKNYKQVPTILYSTQAVAAVLIGSFYVFSSISMLHSLNNEVVKIPSVYNLEHGEPPDITEINQNESINDDQNHPFQVSVEDHVKEDNLVKQFLMDHQDFLKIIINKTRNFTSDFVNKRVVRMVDYQKQKSVFQNLHNDNLCSFKNLFLQHAMFIYSFSQAAIMLINSTINYKKCPSNQTNQEIITDNKYKKLILLLMMLLIPPILTSAAYLTMKDSKENENSSQQQHISQIIENPINVSIITNESQVNNILKNIYEIIKDMESNNLNFMELNATQKYTENSTNCTVNNYDLQISLKIQTFVLFIGGYFLIIIYTQSICSKSDSNNANIRNLKIYLLGFSIMWLPSILELFTRVYFTKNIPDLTTELLTALGNSNHLLTTIYNGMEIRKLIKNQNHVKPITED